MSEHDVIKSELETIYNQIKYVDDNVSMYKTQAKGLYSQYNLYIKHLMELLPFPGLVNNVMHRIVQVLICLLFICFLGFPMISGLFKVNFEEALMIVFCLTFVGLLQLLKLKFAV